MPKITLDLPFEKEVSYNVFLSRKANKQYNSLDQHIQDKVRPILSKLKEDPHKRAKTLFGIKFIFLISFL